MGGITGMFSYSNTKSRVRKEVAAYNLAEFPVVEVSIPDFHEDTPELLSELYYYDFKWGRYQVLLDNMGTTS